MLQDLATPASSLLRSLWLQKRNWVEAGLSELGGSPVRVVHPIPTTNPYLLGTILSDQSHLGGPILLSHHGHLGWDIIALFFHLRKVSNVRSFGWRALLGCRGGWERTAQADTWHWITMGRPGLSPLSPPAHAPHPRAVAVHKGPARSPQ